MPSTLKQDIEKLDALAFHRREYSEDDLRRYHALIRKKGRKALAPLAPLYHWLFIPFTLWPLNVHDVFIACLDTIEVGKPLDAEMRFLLNFLPDPPSGEVCKIVTEHELGVQQGSYDKFLAKPEKYGFCESSALQNPGLLRDWEAIKSRWDVSKFANAKGIIRRTLTGERNLRPRFKVDWSNPRQRFQAAFDAFCARWTLYGMEGEQPLLTKFSVNLTPYGTMIFLPAYWYFDSARDVNWPEVMKLHRAKPSRKQGAVLAEGVEQRRADAAKLKLLDAEAKRRKLKGEARHDFLCKSLGKDPRTDPKIFARLRKDFSDQSGGRIPFAQA